jgi:hypothetical protein
MPSDSKLVCLFDDSLYHHSGRNGVPVRDAMYVHILIGDVQTTGRNFGAAVRKSRLEELKQAGCPATSSICATNNEQGVAHVARKLRSALRATGANRLVWTKPRQTENADFMRLVAGSLNGVNTHVSTHRDTVSAILEDIPNVARGRFDSCHRKLTEALLDVSSGPSLSPLPDVAPDFTLAKPSRHDARKLYRELLHHAFAHAATLYNSLSPDPWALALLRLRPLVWWGMLQFKELKRDLADLCAAYRLSSGSASEVLLHTWATPAIALQLDHPVVQDAGERPLPDFFDSGQTRMLCLRQALDCALKHGVLTPAQKTLVVGNITQMLEISPDALTSWALRYLYEADPQTTPGEVRGLWTWWDSGRWQRWIDIPSPYSIKDHAGPCSRCHYGKEVGNSDCPLHPLSIAYLMRHRKCLERLRRFHSAYRKLDQMPLKYKGGALARADKIIENPDF